MSCHLLTWFSILFSQLYIQLLRTQLHSQASWPGHWLWLVRVCLYVELSVVVSLGSLAESLLVSLCLSISRRRGRSLKFGRMKWSDDQIQMRLGCT